MNGAAHLVLSMHEPPRPNATQLGPLGNAVVVVAAATLVVVVIEAEVVVGALVVVVVVVVVVGGMQHLTVEANVWQPVAPCDEAKKALVDGHDLTHWPAPLPLAEQGPYEALTQHLTVLANAWQPLAPADEAIASPVQLDSLTHCPFLPSAVHGPND